MNDIKGGRSLYLQLVRSRLANSSQVWCLQSVELIKFLEKIQRKTTKYAVGLPFTTEVTYIARLQRLDLLPISYWHGYLDMIFRFRVINGYVHLSKYTNPVREIYHWTRSSNNPSLITLKMLFARTLCYQSSYFIRVSRIWNCLSDNLRSNCISLAKFKSDLLVYYKNALINVYDPENPRT